MAPLAVDPAALDGAGTAVVTTGESLGSVISTLTAALAGCAGMAGDDPAGAALGGAYDRSVPKLIQAMATTRNGVVGLGDGVRMSAHNYSVAEALSNVSGGGDPLPAPRLTAGLSAGSPPTSAVGAGDGVPPGWGWVAPYIGMIWPTGDSAKLRAAATAWGAAGTQFAVAEILGTAGPMGTVRAQQIPEGAAIDAAFTEAYRSTTSIVGQCQTIAAQLASYAARIDAVHAAVLDLLARICDPLTGIKEVWDFLTDEDEDEIKRIADDIATVIDNFTAEAEALGQQIASVLSQAETVLTTMGRQTAKDWDQFLHGNPVGLTIDFAGQRFKGIGEGIWGLGETAVRYNQIRLLVDPLGFGRDGAGVVLGMAPLVGLGGEQAPSVAQSWKELLKGVTHWDEWTTNPGEALGKSEFDLASLFLPGGPLSKAATKGRGLLGGLKKPPDPPVVPPVVKTPPPEPKPVPREQPPEPAPPSKPAPAPAGTTPPHSPTESKPPVAGKPTTDEPPKPTAASQASGAPGEPLPPTHASGGQSADKMPAAAHTPWPAPAVSAPHAPAPQSLPAGGHLPEPVPHGSTPLTQPAATPHPHDVAPHGPGDGSVGTHPGATDADAGHRGPGDAGHPPDAVTALTTDELSALADYTGFGYEDLNNALRNNALDASQQARIDAINTALEKLPTYDGPVVRGSDLSPEVLAQYQPGQFIVEKAFMSTTTDPLVAQSSTFAGNVEFRILSKTGRDISSASIFPAEQEILFPAGTRFYVLSKTIDPLTGKTIIDMMEG